MLLLVRRKSIRISIALTILSDLYYQTHEKLVQQDHLEKIAPNGRCGHLSDGGDRIFCDGETREHVKTTCAKKIEISSPPLHLKKILLIPVVQIDNSVLSYQVPNHADKYCSL